MKISDDKKMEIEQILLDIYKKPSLDKGMMSDYVADLLIEYYTQGYEDGAECTALSEQNKQ